MISNQILQSTLDGLKQITHADFAVTEPVIAAYEYCNLHGLWMAKA